MAAILKRVKDSVYALRGPETPRADGLPHFRVQLVITIFFTALCLWFLPWIHRWLDHHVPAAAAPVQTFALRVECRLPEPGEQVIVLVSDPHHRPAGRCIHVGARGTYGAKASR